jgi:hypothetical protein
MADPATTQSVVADFIAHNITKLGMTGVSVYILTNLVLAIIHRSLDQALQAVGYGGLAMVGWGAAIRSKRGNDMIATVGAEASVARTNIAAAAGVGFVAAVPKSSDPAVQSAINKIQGVV